MLIIKEIRTLASGLWRRQSTNSGSNSDSETVVPGLCYDECNQAGLEAQRTGNIPALCADDSDFMVYVQQCGNCIETFAASPNGTAVSDVVPDLQQFVDFCDSIGDGTQVDINALISSWSSLQATQSAIQLSLSSLGYNLSTRTTTTTTTTTDVSRTTTAATDPAVERQDTTVADTSDSPNVSVIVPAVVVPGVIVPILLLVAGWLWMIRRRKRRKYEEQRSRHATDFEGKAQLHADPFRSELDGENTMRKQLPSELQEDGIVVAELPSREPVGAEMDSNADGTTDF